MTEPGPLPGTGADAVAPEPSDQATLRRADRLGRCGFVALVGAPNAGKSTLLNALIGTKLSIVTPKVQTTRRRILGITIQGDTQLLFIDTPGIFHAKQRLERAMVTSAWQGAGDADLVVLVVDVTRRGQPDAETRMIMERLSLQRRPCILVLNKIDRIQRDRLLPLADRLNRDGPFKDTFMISAATGDGVADLRDALATRMPEGPWLYPNDELTDVPMRVLAADITREKLFLQLRQELPYAATVETESWKTQTDGSLCIAQVIFLQRGGQKAIVLGTGGTRIKAIGEAARKDLEAFLETRVHLTLFVKVREDWTEDPDRYREMGLEFRS